MQCPVGPLQPPVSYPVLLTLDPFFTVTTVVGLPRHPEACFGTLTERRWKWFAATLQSSCFVAGLWLVLVHTVPSGVLLVLFALRYGLHSYRDWFGDSATVVLWMCWALSLFARRQIK